MNHSTLATLAVSASRAMMALGLSLSACSDETAQDCDLAALIPDLANVPSGPRENEIAETLALERSAGVAASPELYASLASDLEAMSVGNSASPSKPSTPGKRSTRTWA